MAADPTQLENVEFINDAERQFFAEAVIGLEVKTFLTSQVGQLLHGCAKAEYDRCRDKMFDLDPYTAKGKQDYLKLKANAWAASHFMQWCTEAMHRGNEAEAMLNDSREGEER